MALLFVNTNGNNIFDGRKKTHQRRVCFIVGIG